MGESSVECASLTEAMNSKALAIESAMDADDVLANITAMATSYTGSMNVQNITDFARDAHQETTDASIAAGLATDQTESLCQTGHWASTVEKRDQFFMLAHQAADSVAVHAAEAKNGLAILIAAYNDMKRLTALIKYDGTEKVAIEQELFVLGEELVGKIEKVELQIEDLENAMDLTKDEMDLLNLGRTRDTLVTEQVSLEDLQLTNEEILNEQLDIKQAFFEEEILPDWSREEPLQFIAKSYGQEKKSATNWNRANEPTGSKEEWFGKFGNLVLEEVPHRLTMAFNITTGGCIEHNTTLLVTVNLTEVPFWSTFHPGACIESTMTPGLIPDVSA